MVDHGRLGVLNVDGDITLTAAIDLAAAGGDLHPVGHFFVFELVVELIHHGLHHARGVGAGNVAMQPTLSMGDEAHRVTGAADREACIFQGLDQRFHLGLVGGHELHR